MREAFLGIDVGTSSIKCSLFSVTGQSIFTVAREYALLRPGPGMMEIADEDLWGAVAATIREITGQAAGKYEIAGAAVCAMMIMPVFLDSGNQMIRPIIHWLDERLMTQSLQLKKQGKDAVLARTSGSLLTGEGTVNAVAWLQEREPEAYRKLAKFCMIKDLVRYHLTGRLGTDYGDASGSLLLETRNWKWNEEAAREFGIPDSAFPDLLRAAEVAGRVSREAAAQTGLKEGTPVAAGSGDGITTILGLGVIEDGQVGITVGSAGVVGIASSQFPEDTLHRNYIFCHPIADRWYSVMATAASGEVLKWYKTNIVRDDKYSYSDLDAEASRAPLEAGGVLFLPYILGSRNPHGNPTATGVFAGLRHMHNRDHLSRALMEGILFELLDLVSVQREILQAKPAGNSSAKLSGGIVRSRFWTQMLADVLGLDIGLTEVDELGTLGCAIMAATAVGAYRSIQDAVAGMVKDREVVGFDRDKHEVYRRKFEVFRKLYKLLETEFILLRER